MLPGVPVSSLELSSFLAVFSNVVSPSVIVEGVSAPSGVLGGANSPGAWGTSFPANSFVCSSSIGF